jgi:hypothetical protein
MAITAMTTSNSISVNARLREDARGGRLEKCLGIDRGLLT